MTIENGSTWTVQEIQKEFKSHPSEVKSSHITDFSAKCFENDGFTLFLNLLKTDRNINTVVLNKSFLTSRQIELILKLVNSNEKKGLKLLNVEGKPFGAAYTDWSVYNEAKKNAGGFGMRETTFEALKHLEPKSEFYKIIDFGASTGQDAIPVLERGDCFVTAIDGDQDALKKLKSQLSENRLCFLTCFTGPFIDFIPTEKADLLISSFTWPYRPESNFPAIWKKTIDVVKPGGLIAGHFFGKPHQPDPGMTYHTEEELKEMLANDFEILWFHKEPAGTIRVVFGGEDPAWGDLFHVVARKKFAE